MVAWNCDDSLVITAQSNFIIKIWNSGESSTEVLLVHELKGHADEIYVLEAHPRDPRIILSASHDGHIIIWNILSGKMIKKFYNKVNFQY
jgi:WD40 repeat protein